MKQGMKLGILTTTAANKPNARAKLLGKSLQMCRVGVRGVTSKGFVTSKGTSKGFVTSKGTSKI